MAKKVKSTFHYGQLNAKQNISTRMCLKTVITTVVNCFLLMRTQVSLDELLSCIAYIQPLLFLVQLAESKQEKDW